MSVDLGRFGVGCGVRFIYGIRRGGDDHKSIESKDGNFGAHLLVVGHDSNIPKGGGGSTSGGDKGVVQIVLLL